LNLKPTVVPGGTINVGVDGGFRYTR
jgi:hypothetical protein